MADEPDVDALGIKDLKALIVGAGLSTEDCIDKADLRARAREALEAKKNKPADGEQSAATPMHGAVHRSDAMAERDKSGATSVLGTSKLFGEWQNDAAALQGANTALHERRVKQAKTVESSFQLAAPPPVRIYRERMAITDEYTAALPPEVETNAGNEALIRSAAESGDVLQEIRQQLSK